MGIKFFFSWLKQEFPQHFQNFKKTAPPADVIIDTFMIDLNGVFHNSAAKVYQYGAYEKKSLLRKPTVETNQNEDPKLRLRCFQDICSTIDELVQLVKPQKKLVLCVDGVAPLSKQNQQRQRRYRSLVEDSDKNPNAFDSRCITPGTKFMDYLSKYIDMHIRKSISENPRWSKLDVIFSNEKVPGEGEHKLMDYIRAHGTDEETYCINALDADLVMLSLGSHKKNFYLLREELYDNSFDYAYFNVGSGLRTDLVKNVMYWEGSNETQLINDFILFCFMCGNDFLPNIPSISLMEKGMTTIVDMYKLTASANGHLTDKSGRMNIPTFQLFMAKIGQCEKALLEEKYLRRIEYMPDPLLEKHIKEEKELDFESYRSEFYEKHDIQDLDSACHSYIKGCEWILSYYLNGVENWSYVYQKNYSPFAYDLTLSLTTYRQMPIEKTKPISPFLQLLCVIPPSSAFLLPRPLDTVLTRRSKLSKYFPTSFKINYDGKRRKWEGVVELPLVDLEDIRTEYTRLLSQVDNVDAKRNIFGKSFLYRRNEEFSSRVKTFYGTFTSVCTSEVVVF